MSCSRGGIHPGLERLQAALAALGHPERQFAAVQVAGTNGKGSICSLVHSALQAAGIRCGLYTSPHLVSWTERIQLGDKAIASIELQRLLERIQPIARQFELSPFELITAAAFCAFAAAGVELAVLEVGMGGRLDATSCHPQRRVIGFATVGLDHQEWLGSSLAAIAAEKAAVLQPDALACSAPQHPEVAAVLNQRASAVGAQLRWLEPLDLNSWSLGLPGQVQARNGAVALGMLQALAVQGWPLDGDAIRQGFAAARWPGRLQPWRWRHQPLLLDGAHNLPAAQALRSELDRHPQRHGLQSGPSCWVLGVLANKQGPELIEALLGPEDRAWLTPVPGEASWELADLLAAKPQLAGKLEAAADLETALASASAAARGARLVVAGSLYLLGALLASGAAAPEAAGDGAALAPSSQPASSQPASI